MSECLGCENGWPAGHYHTCEEHGGKIPKLKPLLNLKDDGSLELSYQAREYVKNLIREAIEEHERDKRRTT